MAFYTNDVDFSLNVDGKLVVEFIGTKKMWLKHLDAHLRREYQEAVEYHTKHGLHVTTFQLWVGYKIDKLIRRSTDAEVETLPRLPKI